MQKWLTAARTRESERESNHLPAVKRREYLAARVVRHHKNCRRHSNVLAPGEQLHLYAFLVLAQSFAMADFDVL
jgi:hypothetical protein